MKMKQIFAHIEVTDADRGRLQDHLRSWPALNEAYVLHDFSLVDIEKMITIEANTRNRPQMLKKLVGKRSTIVRRKLYERLGIE